MTENAAETAGVDDNRAFERKVVDVRKVFGEAMAEDDLRQLAGAPFVFRFCMT